MDRAGSGPGGSLACHAPNNLFADVILPAATWGEWVGGTYIQSERRLYVCDGTANPIEGTRPDIDMVIDKGIHIADKLGLDGKKIFPILQGKESESPHKFLYYYNGTNLQAVREGEWKLHLPRTAKDQPFWSKKPAKGKGFVTLNERRLFDLKSDVGEKRNVADRYPEVVARLQKHAETIRAELGDVRTTGADQRKINLVDPQER